MLSIRTLNKPFTYKRSEIKNRTKVRSNVQDDPRIFLHRLYNDYTVEVREVEKWFLDKYKRVVDINFIRKYNSMNIEVSYMSPQDPQLYSKKMIYLCQMLNLWKCAMLFKGLLDQSEYPDFIINRETMELVDIPVIIPIDIPCEYDISSLSSE